MVSEEKKEARKREKEKTEQTKDQAEDQTSLVVEQHSIEQQFPAEQEVQEIHDPFFTHKIILLIAIAALLFFNQLQIGTAATLLGVSVPLSTGSSGSSLLTFSGDDTFDLDAVDVTQIKTTAQGIALLFPVSEIKTTDDAIAVLIPSGVPSYGEAMGVSYDDPVGALTKLEKGYPALKKLAKENDDVWQRYLNLAAAPRGISCEFCCGVGPQGVDASGELRCGCAHNPAVQSVTLWLMLNTEYSDAEILKEVYKWKSLWFPKNMVGLSLDIAGGDTSVLQDLPGMVGGC